MRRSRGQALVEGAISAFVLVLLVFGTLDFTGAYWRCQGMQHAAVAGAEWASMRGTTAPSGMTVGPGPDDAQVKTFVKSVAAGFEPTRITVHSEWPDDDGVEAANSPGKRVKVTTSHPLPITITRMFFPSGCGAPALECRGAAVRTIQRY